MNIFLDSQPKEILTFKKIAPKILVLPKNQAETGTKPISFEGVKIFL